MTFQTAGFLITGRFGGRPALTAGRPPKINVTGGKNLIIVAFALIAILTGVDQWIKIWVLENLKDQPSREFIKFGDLKVLNLTYLENDGAVFGSFSGMRIMLVVVTSIMIIACMVIMVKNIHKSKFFTISLAMVSAGGIGNLIDRIFRDGKVVDMFDVQLFNFAIFNFADCCVVIGVIMLIIYLIFLDKEEVSNDSGKRTD